MSRKQWLVLGGLASAVLVVYAYLILLITGAVPDPDRPVAAVSELVPTSTATLRPTFTSTPTPTDTPTFTPTPTDTPTDTPTHTPTPTDTPTNTPRPRPKATSTPIPPTETPTPDVDFRLAKVRRLSPCENHGNHHIYIYVLDKEGNGLPNVKVRVTWGPEGAELVTGKKPEISPGYVDFPMFKGTHAVQIMDYKSEVASGITPDIPIDEPCNETGNMKGNSLYHYSYEVVFQRTY